MDDHLRAYRISVSKVVVLEIIDHVIQKADASVSPDWLRRCYKVDKTSEQALAHARFHAAPALRDS